jgi:hypothetical protein
MTKAELLRHLERYPDAAEVFIAVFVRDPDRVNRRKQPAAILTQIEADRAWCRPGVQLSATFDAPLDVLTEIEAARKRGTDQSGKAQLAAMIDAPTAIVMKPGTHVDAPRHHVYGGVIKKICGRVAYVDIYEATEGTITRRLALRDLEAVRG